MEKVPSGDGKSPTLQLMINCLGNQFPSLGAFQKLPHYHKPMVDKTAVAVAIKNHHLTLFNYKELEET